VRLAIATCESPPVPDSDAERLIPALAERGVEAELVAWTDAGADWTRFDLIWISSTWDYHERLAEFLDWLRRAAEAAPVQNPPVLIEWNVDKRYLRELGEAGVPVIPTVWVEGEGGPAVREAAQHGWSEVIVKPAVDLGAARLERTDAVGLRAAVERVERPALVQPFLDSVESEGELSLVYLAGELSHSIRKRPADGDFRVQPVHGGRHEEIEAPAEATEIGERTLAAIGDRVARARGDGGRAPLYARVDLIRGPDGGLCLIELELIEPYLFLDAVGEVATARFADLLTGTMGS
jgi:glutathione synthase/RimK-type ligase-like ATP-grasp enzyme